MLYRVLESKIGTSPPTKETKVIFSLVDSHQLEKETMMIMIKKTPCELQSNRRRRRRGEGRCNSGETRGVRSKSTVE